MSISSHPRNIHDVPPQSTTRTMLPSGQYLQAPPYLAPTYSNGSTHSLYSSMQDPTSATSTNAPQLVHDPNSPELFKANVRAIKEDIIKLQALAQDVLSGIQHAFEPNHNPLSTENKTQQLKQDLSTLVERLRQTGVGALPVLSDSTTPPTEAELMTICMNGLKSMYEKLQKSQESAAVVANLVSPEYISKSSSLPSIGPVAMSTPTASFGK